MDARAVTVVEVTVNVEGGRHVSDASETGDSKRGNRGCTAGGRAWSWERVSGRRLEGLERDIGKARTPLEFRVRVICAAFAVFVTGVTALGRGGSSSASNGRIILRPESCVDFDFVGTSSGSNLGGKRLLRQRQLWDIAVDAVTIISAACSWMV